MKNVFFYLEYKQNQNDENYFKIGQLIKKLTTAWYIQGTWCI